MQGRQAASEVAEQSGQRRERERERRDGLRGGQGARQYGAAWPETGLQRLIPAAVAAVEDCGG